MNRIQGDLSKMFSSDQLAQMLKLPKIQQMDQMRVEPEVEAELEIVEDDMFDPQIEIGAELQEMGVSGPLTFFDPELNQLFEDVKIVQIKKRPNQESLLVINTVGDRCIMLTLNELNAYRENFRGVHEFRSKCLKQNGLDIALGVFSDPETGDVTPDVKLVSLSRTGQGELVARFIKKEGSFKLNMPEFVGQINRAKFCKKSGLRLRDYAGLDLKNRAATFQIVGPSDRPNFVQMQLKSSGLQQDFPIWYVRQVVKNQQILNEEVLQDKFTNIIKRLKALGRQVDESSTFEDLLPLMSEFEVFDDTSKFERSFGGYASHFMQFKLIRDNNKRFFDDKLQELAPHRKIMLDVTDLKNSVKSGTSSISLTSYLSQIGVLKKNLLVLETADYMKVFYLRRDFDECLLTLNKLELEAQQKLQALILFEGLQSAIEDLQPAYPADQKILANFKEKYCKIPADSRLNADKIKQKTALMLDQFRYSFLDAFYTDQRHISKTPALASLHAKGVALYKEIFNPIDRNEVEMGENPKQFQTNIKTLLRYFELWNYSEEVACLSEIVCIETADQNGSVNFEYEALLVELQEDLGGLGDLTQISEAEYSKFKLYENSLNKRVDSIRTDQLTLLSNLVQRKLRQLALAYGCEEELLEDGLLDELFDMIESGIVQKNKYLPIKDGKLQEFQVSLQTIATVYQKVMRDLSTDLSEYKDSFFVLLSKINLAIAVKRKPRAQAFVPANTRGVLSHARRGIARLFGRKAS